MPPAPSVYEGLLPQHAQLFMTFCIEAQSSRELHLRQACNEIVRKSSNIVPLGAPSKTYPILSYAAFSEPVGTTFCSAAKSSRSIFAA